MVEHTGNANYADKKAMDTPQTVDAWKYTVDLLLMMQRAKLSCVTSAEKQAYCTALGNQRNRRARLDHERVIHLHIVEKCSTSTVTVCWRDATSGCYEEQLWKMMVARAVSTCALSGLQIRPGDAVFRPSARGYKPANGDSMILVSAVKDMARNEQGELPGRKSQALR
ncbi:hypothetical protein AWB64_02004 [Caballeronia sordidicola]|uniref:DUF3331 domain-containing protein n=1 Tax=Caballeronia sordidicola TaxID=196367 RepID=A0A158FZJ9_CABSO|nr:DUF3331 domain-containing protein [Caballeronia sordidicola]SAL25083.1 hypothetical protein AWB64_02004 [Caballeronia sordidicola]